MYGYTLEEVRQCTIDDLSSNIPPYTIEEGLKELAKAAAGEIRIFEWQARRRNGETFWVEINLKAAVLGGEECVLTVCRDISERKRLEAELVAMAHHDGLTGLPNRKLLQDRARQMFAAAQRHGTGAALIFLDLNGFKQINDTLGHRAGDLVLKEFAALLSRSVRESDTVARFGGDEFIAVLAGINGTADALVVADKILTALQTPFIIEQASIPVGASIGMAFYPRDGTDLETLIHSADAAMYRSKELQKSPEAVALPR
jgi:diguanylate cyclase (GGDEF)-like protein/PAS domain S-box-containing protein